MTSSHNTKEVPELDASIKSVVQASPGSENSRSASPTSTQLSPSRSPLATEQDQAPPVPMTSAELEILFHRALAESNRKSKLEPEVLTGEIATAKMLNDCIRMLHAEGWVPRTVVQAMVKLEELTARHEERRSTRTYLYRAYREERDEYRAAVRAEAEAEVDGEVREGFVAGSTA